MRTESPRFNHKGVVAYIRTPPPQKKRGVGETLSESPGKWFGLAIQPQVNFLIALTLHQYITAY